MLMFHCQHVLQKNIGTSVKKPKDPQTDFPTAFFLISVLQRNPAPGRLFGWTEKC